MISPLNRPLISVIIPTRNRAALVQKAITSVLQQSYSMLECIVVDDASEDNSPEIITTISDPRLRYVRNSTCRGAPASRNCGIAQARGSYIALLDDDDEWLPEKIEKQVALFSRAPDTVGLVYSGFVFVTSRSSNVFATVIPKKRGYVYKDMLRSCIIGSPTPLIKKECFERVGLFDEDLPSCQDWDMWLRIAKKYEFDFVPEVLARHCVHGEQISASLERKINGRCVLLKKHEKDIQKLAATHRAHLQRLAVLYMLSGDKKSAQKFLKRALMTKPFQISGYLHLFLLLFPRTYRALLYKKCILHVDGIPLYY